jgi:hypothetical protein
MDAVFKRSPHAGEEMLAILKAQIVREEDCVLF